MSRNYKARSKATQKMSKDGLVERNAVTGEDIRLSNRETDFDLRGQFDRAPDVTPDAESGSMGFSQVGKSPQVLTPTDRSRQKQTLRHSKADTPASATETKPGVTQSPDNPAHPRPSDIDAQAGAAEMAADTTSADFNALYNNADTPGTALVTDGTGSKLRQQSARQVPHDTVQNLKNAKHHPQYQPSTGEIVEPPPSNLHGSDYNPNSRPLAEQSAAQPDTATHTEPPKPAAQRPESRLNLDKTGRLQFTKDEAVAVNGAVKKPQGGKRKPQQLESEPATQDNGQPRSPAHTITQPSGGDNTASVPEQAKGHASHEAKRNLPSEKQDSRLQADKQGKLQFAPDEAAPDTPKIHHNRKLAKAQAQAVRVTGKLEKARDNLPSKKKLRKVSVTDKKTGAVKRKLQFEKTPISQGEHIKGALPLRPVKAAGNSLMLNAHRKLYQVEHENVGTKAAHRAEMVAEGGVRTALRFHKTAPYRKVEKLERAVRKKSVNLNYRQLLDQNPKMKSNIVTRALQKRKIKKDYAKAAREAQKAAKQAKKAGSATVEAGKAVVAAVKRHPVATVVILLVALLLFAVMSLIGVGGSIGSGGIGAVSAGTYLAEDADILGAQAAYAGMEAELQQKLDNYEALNPGYDEYVYDLDSIWHDPYSLTAILSALHEGAWTLDEVQGTLTMLFERQYILTETTTIQVRSRPEDVLDPDTGQPTGETVDVPYNHYIRTVTLENFNLSHLPIYIMGETALSRYAMYMMTLGNRPDLFPVGAYPNASYYKDYGRHDIPQEYLEADPVFATIITEAEKWLGMPYVWGGYSPVTSFDCSGYVSWVLNQSGWSVGRLGARALYGICTPVSASDAKPGDLIFFHSTYKTETPGISHVGIYVGDGMMVHCGNPIGYANINTSYWQAHFYGYGRP